MQLPRGVVVAWQRSTGDRRSVSRFLLRALLVDRMPGSIDFVQQCARCGSPSHGRLRVRLSDQQSAPHREPAALVSVSYAGDLAVVGVAPPGTACFGLDAESDTARTRGAAAEALGRSAEASRTDLALRDWTEIEARAKAEGRGLREAPAEAREDLVIMRAVLSTEPRTLVSVAIA